MSKYSFATRTRNYYKTIQEQDGYNYSLGEFSSNTANISEDFIASGFTESKYLDAPIEYKSSNNAEYCVKFTTGSVVTSVQEIWLAEYLFNIGLVESGNFVMWNWGSSNSTSLLKASPNTTYWFKVRINGTSKIYYYSTDGINYTSATFTDSSMNASNTTYPLRLGTHINSGDLWRYFQGTIDLRETYININGERVWDAVLATPIYKDVEVSATKDDYEYYRDTINGYSPATRIRKYYKYWKYEDVFDYPWTQPVFSANTLTDSGIDYTLTASHESQPAWWAFNGDSTTGDNCWWTAHGITSTSNPCWISFYSSTKIKLSQVDILNEHVSNENFQTGVLQASNDGSGWVDLATITGTNTAAYTTTVNVSTEIGYHYYRLYFTASYSTSGVSIQTITLYGTKHSETVSVEGTSDDYDYTTESTVDDYDYYEDINLKRLLLWQQN